MVYYYLSNNMPYMINVLDEFSFDKIESIRKNKRKAFYSNYYDLVYDGNDYLFLYSNEMKNELFSDIDTGLVFFYSDKIKGKLNYVLTNDIKKLNFFVNFEPLLIKAFIQSIGLDEKLFVEYLI